MYLLALGTLSVTLLSAMAANPSVPLLRWTWYRQNSSSICAWVRAYNTYHAYHALHALEGSSIPGCQAGAKGCEGGYAAVIRSQKEPTTEAPIVAVPHRQPTRGSCTRIDRRIDGSTLYRLGIIA